MISSHQIDYRWSRPDLGGIRNPGEKYGSLSGFCSYLQGRAQESSLSAQQGLQSAFLISSLPQLDVLPAKNAERTTCI